MWITKKKLFDLNQIEIFNEDEDDFWEHHGRNDKDKEHLRYLANLLPTAIEKKQKGFPLKHDEEYSYRIFILDGPKIFYYADSGSYGICDGRHRICMLRDEGIQVELNVSCNIDFSNIIKYPKECFYFLFKRNKINTERSNIMDKIDNNSRVNTILRTEDILENNNLTNSKVLDKFNTSDGRVYEVLISYKQKEN